MIQLGKQQDLCITRIEPIGCYLGDHYESRGEDVLLPGKWMPDGVQVGDWISVFVYKDSEDRPIATTMKPALEVDGVALLRVVDVTRIGAFLDWGLEKDLFLPFHEQRVRIKPGDECLVTLYIDKSERLCASMTKVYHRLQADAPYQKGDEVDGFVYEVTEEHGAYVAVDNLYSARIAPQEMRGSLAVGQHVKARVTAVKEDGKLDLSLQKKVADQMVDDAEAVAEKIRQRGGSIPFTDKADPEQIREVFDMSKNAFKRAVGRLLKEGRIRIGENEIDLLS